ALIAHSDGGFGFGAPGGSYTLDGRDSIGVFPISYEWTQLSGPPVTITPSSGLGAGAPVITLPATLSVLQFRLTITDGEGRQASTISQVRVAEAPTAFISPPSTLALTSGQPITLDASGSTDPNALLLVFSWSQLTGPAAVITPLPGGRCLVTAPVVTTPTSFTIGLKLANAFGVSATATPVTFTVTPAAVPDAGNWSIDVPSPIAAVGGQLVTLSVTPQTTVVGATFDYEWTPATDPLPASEWVLSSGAVQTPTFIAPNPVGLPRTLTFQVRVTAQNAALQPSQLFGTVVVNIADETAPTLIGSTLNGAGQASGVGVSFTFSEPLDPASTNGVYVSDFNGGHAITVTVSGNQLTITPNELFVEGGHYTVTLSNLRDRSPRQNVVTTLTRDWYPTFNFSVAWQSSTTSTNEPYPGILAHRGGGNPTEVQLVGTRQDGGVFEPWLLTPVLAFNQTCDPCIVNDGPAVAATIQNALREGDRVFTHLGLSHVQLEQAGFGPATTSLVLAATPQRGVSVLSPATDGVLYSDGATLRSVGPT
ncbi:MAG: Ig-like domain-containing protein, partial [Archangium sp.]|nr:Ig-like domain-containing protein [Archangium sp.]